MWQDAFYHRHLAAKLAGELGIATVGVKLRFLEAEPESFIIQYLVAPKSVSNGCFKASKFAVISIVLSLSSVPDGSSARQFAIVHGVNIRGRVRVSTNIETCLLTV